MAAQGGSESPAAAPAPPAASATSVRAQPDEGPPASPWLAIGVMALIAVVTAVSVLAWARLRGSEPGDPEPLAEAQPDSLAGGLPLGEVPEELAAAFDEPVLGVRLLDELPGDFDSCDFMDVFWEDEPEVELAVATPDMLYVSLVGLGNVDGGHGFGFRGEVMVDGFTEGPPPDMPPPPAGEMPAPAPDLGGELQRWRVTCSQEWDGRGFAGGGGGSSGPADEDLSSMGGGGSSCCDAQGMATMSAMATAPDGAAWAVQERGGWWLAYPVTEHRTVPLSWKARQGFRGGFEGMGTTSTHVQFFDDAGQQIDETWVGM